jgi:hypothetical protein
MTTWQQSLLRQLEAPENDPTVQALKGQALQYLDWTCCDLWSENVDHVSG